MDDSALLDQLIFAIEELDGEAVRTLVEVHGARVLDLNLVDHRTRMAREYAMYRAHPRAARLLARP